MNTMKNKDLQKGNVLIIFLFIAIVILLVVLAMKFLNLGLFNKATPVVSVSSSSTSQGQVVNDSDDLKVIENDLDDASVLGANTELETIQSDLNSL